MRFLPSGDAGLLLECADLDEVDRLRTAVGQRPPPGVLDLVPAARTLLLVLDPEVTSPAEAREAVTDLEAKLTTGQGPGTSSVNSEAGEPLSIPVTYDGEDLEDVAGMLSCPEDEVVRRHTAEIWRVAFCGFAPGFGYLVAEGRTGHDAPEWSVARRESPRKKVPAGSVALAGEFTSVYPRASPGGWQLIGRTEMTMFDLDRDPPATLTPGTRVSFVAEDA